MSNLYRVAKGSLRKPRDPKAGRKFSTAADFLGQGELIPDGMLSAQELSGLLSKGIVELVPVRIGESIPLAPARRGRWSVDPAGLIGKGHEELILMVLEIDADFDVSTLPDIQATVRQLTADWNPAYREEVSRSTDRTRPEQLGTQGTKDRGSKPMSGAAEAALERAKEAASRAENAHDPKID